MQFTNPLAPQLTALSLRLQALVLRWRGMPSVPGTAIVAPNRITETKAVHAAGWTPTSRSLAPS
jgi:hypothetical protein